MEIDVQKILKTWLADQCRLLSGSVHAVLLTGPPNDGTDHLSLVWPEGRQDYTTLTRVAKAAFHKQQAVVRSQNNQIEKTGEPLDAMACPLFLDGRLFGVVAIEVTSRSKPMQEATVQHVQTGAKWLETMIRQHASTTKAQLVNLVDLVATALEQEQFPVAATEVTNEISERFSCRRVSIGFLKRNRIRLAAMSHCSQIDHHSNIIRSIEDAMGESLDQCSTVVYPETSDTTALATRFHARLSDVQQGASICTAPLIKNGTPVGSLLLERSPDKPFSPEIMVQCEQVALLIGPVLETRRRDERILPLKIFESFQDGFIRLFGAGHLTLKLTTVLIGLLIIWMSIASSMFHVSCDSQLQASIRRVVTAPQQGYLAEAHVRAGDLVREGDLLATLDDQALRLEQRKWQSQHAQLLKKYRKALAGFDRAEVAIFNAQRAQAEAQLKLIEHQISRTSLTAPFSGLVVKGDLSQALGSPVTRGEVLYEIAPIDEYRVMLKVDERDIGLIALGQTGQLKLSGIPDKIINITIDRLTPVASTEEGRNYFSVEAFMDDHSDLMRPGMEGITKIKIGEKKLAWICTRRLVDWLRLFTWSRLP